MENYRSYSTDFSCCGRQRLNGLREKLDKGTNATSKRTVSSVGNGGCTLPSNVISGSDFDCFSHIKNARFHQFDIGGIERT